MPPAHTSGMPPRPAAVTSARASVATLLNSAIGAGVLSLPIAFKHAGWALGLVSTIVIAAIEGFTLYVLARYAEYTGTYSYSQLVRKMLKRKASIAMSIILLLYSFGSSVAYLIILGDCFTPLAQAALGADHWYTSRQSVIGIGASAFMLPLCFPTTLGAIASVSFMTAYSILLVVAAVVFRSTEIIRGDEYSWGDATAWNWSMEYFKAVPILVFGFQCHTNVITVFGELEDEPVLFGSTPSLTTLAEAAEAGADGVAGASRGSSAASEALAAQQQERQSRYQSLPRMGTSGRFDSLRRPKSLKLQGMVGVILAAIGLTCVFYLLVGLFGYLAFPNSVASNVLNSFPASDRLMQATRAVVGVIQVFHYPVGHFPARNAFRDLLHALGWRPRLEVFNVTETLVYFCCSLTLSMVVKDLGSVFALIGGSCGAAFIFAFPGALLIHYAWSKQTQSREALSDAQEALLGEGGSDAGGRAWPAPYDVRWSKLFWSGVLLLLLSFTLFGLTIYGIVTK